MGVLHYRCAYLIPSGGSKAQRFKISHHKFCTQYMQKMVVQYMPFESICYTDSRRSSAATRRKAESPEADRRAARVLLYLRNCTCSRSRHDSQGTIIRASGPRARHIPDLRGRAGTVVGVRLRRQAVGQREERLGAELSWVRPEATGWDAGG